MKKLTLALAVCLSCAYIGVLLEKKLVVAVSGGIALVIVSPVVLSKKHSL